MPDGLLYSNDNYVNQQNVAPWKPDHMAESDFTIVGIAVVIKKAMKLKDCCGHLKNVVVVEENLFQSMLQFILQL